MKRIICAVLILSIAVAFGTATAFAMDGGAITVMDGEVELIKSAIKGKKVAFSDKDFKSALAIADFKSITVDSLPPSTEGVLMLAGRRVSEGQTIKRRHLGGLTFVPESREVCNASFRFTLKADREIDGIVCRINFLDKVNYAPKHEALSSPTLSTQASIPYHGSLYATDPEGDALYYMVVAYPDHGSLHLDKSSGNFIYSPTEGSTGTDSFTYVVRDCYGNYTKPCKVQIKVTERMSEQVYVDMTDRAEYNAAVAMCSMGILNPSRLGDDLFFNPDRSVTKGEFVAMALKAYGIKADSTLEGSFFDDDGDIPTSLSGYVATAARLGIIDGELVDGKLLFSPNSEITKYEAASIIARMLSLPESEEDAQYSDAAVPVWAKSAVSAMYTIGIFGRDTDPTAKATRAECAEYLYRMIKRS